MSDFHTLMYPPGSAPTKRYQRIELEGSLDQVQVGDVITEWQFNNNAWATGGDLRITSIGVDGTGSRYYFYCPVPARGEELFHRTDPNFRVRFIRGAR